MSRIAVVLISLLALGLAASDAAAQEPARGRCLGATSGPICQFTYARLISVSDGDTIRVDLDGQTRNIRFVGIQAMELTRYSRTPSKRVGDCHGLEAAAMVDDLMRQGGDRVRLAAQHPTADSRGRLERSIAVDIDGRWVDVGRREMAAGLTLWLPNLAETAWNRIYNTLGQRAAQRHIGMFDTTHCGVGPDQDIPLKVWVQSDPPGPDTHDIDGEWIKVRNLSADRPLALGGWWVRDSMLRRYTFPAGTTLAPGQTATVHAGHGDQRGLDFFWGLDVNPFQNATTQGDEGDGAYLFDPQGDLRGWMIYPCLVACSDPLQGRVRLSADARDESVAITNVSGGAVDLYGYELGNPAEYAFGEHSMLPPGQTMQVDMGGRPSDDTALHRHAGFSGPMLPNPGGSLALTTFDDIVIACDAWGSGHC